MMQNRLILRVLSVFTLFFFSLTAYGQANLDEGKDLFRNNCASCHNKDMKSKMTGPALGKVEERWEGREELLYEWIRNSQGVIASGDEYAVSLYNEWGQTLMNPFPNLTDEQITNIISYVNFVYDNGAYPLPEGGDIAAAGAGGQETDNTWLYWTIFGVLIILCIILANIISNLNYLKEVRETGSGSRKTLIDILTSKTVISLVLFGLIIFGGYNTINSAISLNRQQGYQPDQPIKFSHVTHAGDQGIECQYCHDGARRSKHSIIPAANTCMNCHKAVKVGSSYGTAELTKIYASTGYDPNTDKYVDNMSNDKAEEIYKKWMATQYNVANSKEETAKLDKAGEQLVNDQWDGIVSSLTTDVKESVYGPIPWIRLHNLPDHAYFNHAQHVTVGGIECQTCHGKVEEMEVVQQYSPLSMGWCINCHRNTKINNTGVAEDYYNTHYKELSEGVKTGEVQQFHVEDIGGLECQKCHY